MATPDYLNTPLDGIKEPTPIAEGTWRVRFGNPSVKQRDGEDFSTVAHPIRPLELIEGVAGDYDAETAEDEWWRVRLNSQAAAYEYRRTLEGLGADTSISLLSAARQLAGKEAFVKVVHRPNEKNPARPWVDFKQFVAA